MVEVDGVLQPKSAQTVVQLRVSGGVEGHSKVVKVLPCSASGHAGGLDVMADKLLYALRRDAEGRLIACVKTPGPSFSDQVGISHAVCKHTCMQFCNF